MPLAVLFIRLNVHMHKRMRSYTVWDTSPMLGFASEMILVTFTGEIALLMNGQGSRGEAAPVCDLCDLLVWKTFFSLFVTFCLFLVPSLTTYRTAYTT